MNDESLIDGLRKGSRAMHDASSPVADLLPPGFGPAASSLRQLPDDRTAPETGGRRIVRIAAWAATIAAAAVIVGVVLGSRGGPDADLTTATTPHDAPAGRVAMTLYADGEINDCPDNLADLTDLPAGEITFTAIAGGVEIHVALRSAAPDWSYVVHVFEELPQPAEHCAVGLESFHALMTDSDGHGELTATLALPPGVHAIGVNIAAERPDVPFDRHAEISTDGYAVVTVADRADS